MAFISRSTLSGDIYNYKRLQAKDLSINRYVASERIVEKAENILMGYEQNKLHIHDSDHKLMARYIEIRISKTDMAITPSSHPKNKYRMIMTKTNLTMSEMHFYQLNIQIRMI